MAQSGNPPLDVSLPGAGLEYRAGDDAWYNVKVSLQGERLTLNYSMLLGSPNEELYDARDFKSLHDVLRFRNRFRPLSAQVQDTECRNVVPGIKVCASYRSSEDDLRYFDAVVEQVDFNVHSVKKGEEQCLCTFILYWLHGPGVGNLTTATIADICLLKDGVIDQTLSEFIGMAKMMVNDYPMHSGVPFPASGSDIKCEHQPSNAVHEPGDEKEIACNQGDTIGQEDEASFEHHNQDTDMGGVDMVLRTFAMGGYNYGVVVDNLDKDLTPSTMMKFILKEANINSRAHIFPSLPLDMYTRGVIEVKSREEILELNEFLESSHQIIVSSHNRPWVISQRLLLQGEVGAVMLAMESQQVHSAGCDTKLKVVRSGMPEYNMAKQHRENFMEFYRHGKLVMERLAFEEQKIISRWIVN